MDHSKILEIDGLSALQFEELKSELIRQNVGESLSQAPPSALSGGRHGEPGLLDALIQLTPAVLSIVTLWLAKQKGTRTDKLRYRKILPDGTSEEIDFRRSSYEEGSASASQIESILKEKLDGVPTGTST